MGEGVRGVEGGELPRVREHLSIYEYMHTSHIVNVYSLSLRGPFDLGTDVLLVIPETNVSIE